MENEKALKKEEMKALEAKILEFLATVNGHPRWVAIAKTHFEEGSMAVEKSLYVPVGPPQAPRPT